MFRAKEWVQKFRVEVSAQTFQLLREEWAHMFRLLREVWAQTFRPLRMEWAEMFQEASGEMLPLASVEALQDSASTKTLDVSLAKSKTTTPPDETIPAE